MAVEITIQVWVKGKDIEPELIHAQDYSMDHASECRFTEEVNDPENINISYSGFKIQPYKNVTKES